MKLTNTQKKSFIDAYNQIYSESNSTECEANLAPMKAAVKAMGYEFILGSELCNDGFALDLVNDAEKRIYEAMILYSSLVERAHEAYVDALGDISDEELKEADDLVNELFVENVLCFCTKGRA